ncbi:MAG: glycosyltransferase [Gammaproteobacteria bacterium]|nr:glycosyltransferase [Gammaproteobacteria bacterium]
MPVIVVVKSGPLLEQWRRFANICNLSEGRFHQGLQELKERVRRIEHHSAVLRQITQWIEKWQFAVKQRAYRRVLSKIRPGVVVNSECARNRLVDSCGTGDALLVQHLTQPATSLYRMKDEAMEWLRDVPDAYIAEGVGVLRVATDFLGVDSNRIYLNCVGVDRERVIEVPGNETIDVDRMIGKAEFVVMGCASLIYTKGVDLWVRAAIRVISECSDIKPLFVWLGGREKDFGRYYGSTIRRMIHESGLEQYFRFVGHVEDVFCWLERADIFVQPSRDDAYPHAIMEAMLLGKPCVAFPVGIGLEEYAVGAIRVVREISDKALANEILDLIDSPEARTEIGGRARQLMEGRFEVRRTVEEYWHQLSEIRLQGRATMVTNAPETIDEQIRLRLG